MRHPSHNSLVSSFRLHRFCKLRKHQVRSSLIPKPSGGDCMDLYEMTRLLNLSRGMRLACLSCPLQVKFILHLQWGVFFLFKDLFSLHLPFDIIFYFPSLFCYSDSGLLRTANFDHSTCNFTQEIHFCRKDWKFIKHIGFFFFPLFLL